MNTIFIDENIPYLSEIISNDFEVIKFSGRDLNSQMLIDENCIALFVRSTTRVSENLLSGTNVKFVASASSGIDHINTQYLIDNNIKFSYALGANSNSVAEYVIFGLLLQSLTKHREFKYLAIGIIAFGNIGKKVAYYCHKLNIKIYVNDPLLRENNYDFPKFCEYCSLDELLTKSNIITNHVPLVINGKYPTYDLLTYNNLQVIKNNALIIHLSRGGVINENDLTKLLKQREDIELIIDVFENEPNVNKYLIQRSIIATPHIAGYSHNGKINGVNMVLDDFELFQNKKFDRAILNQVVNNLESDFCFNELKECFENINNNRLLLEDSLKLNDILGYNSVDTRDAFDRFRREYPKRLEYLKINFDEFSKLFLL